MNNHAPALPAAFEVFSGLDARETRFVVEYVIRGGERGAGADAALAAGYSRGNRDAAYAMSSKLLRRPLILKAIKDELGRKLTSAAVLGVAVLEKLATSAVSEQVRLSAARELVDRGYGPVVSKSAAITAEVPFEALLDKLDAQERAEREQATPLQGEVIESTPLAPCSESFDDTDYDENEHLRDFDDETGGADDA